MSLIIVYSFLAYIYIFSFLAAFSAPTRIRRKMKKTKNGRKSENRNITVTAVLEGVCLYIIYLN